MRIIIHLPGSQKANPPLLGKEGFQKICLETKNLQQRALTGSSIPEKLLCIQKKGEIHVLFIHAKPSNEETKNPRYAQAAALLSIHEKNLPLPENTPMFLTLRRPQLKEGFHQRTQETKRLKPLETFEHTDWWNHISKEEAASLVRHLSFQTQQTPKVGQLLCLRHLVSPEELTPEKIEGNNLWIEVVDEYIRLWEKINHHLETEPEDIEKKKLLTHRASHWACQECKQILWVQNTLRTACEDLTRVIPHLIPDFSREQRISKETMEEATATAVIHLGTLMTILTTVRDQAANGYIGYDQSIEIINGINLLDEDTNPAYKLVNEKLLEQMPFPSWFITKGITIRGELPPEVLKWIHAIIKGTAAEAKTWPSEEIPAFREITKNLRITTLACQSNGSSLVAGLIQRGLAPSAWMNQPDELEKLHAGKNIEARHILQNPEWTNTVIQHPTKFGETVRTALAEKI